MNFRSPGRDLPGSSTGYYALGGGLAGFLIHLFIWRMIWRVVMLLWHIPTFGPIIVGLIVIAVIVLALLRSAGRWPRRRRGGIFHYGTGRGPRDW